MVVTEIILNVNEISGNSRTSERLVKRLAMDHQVDWWDGMDHLPLVMGQERDIWSVVQRIGVENRSLKSL